METLEKECSQLFQRIGKAYGLKDLQVRVFATIFLEPGEIAMEEVAKRTGYSLSSISNTVNLLEDLGMIERKRKPGSRKVYLYMQKDLIKLNISKLIKFRDTSLRQINSNLPDIIRRYKQKAKDKESKERLAIIQNYYKQVNQFEEIISKWIKDLEELSKETAMK